MPFKPGKRENILSQKVPNFYKYKDTWWYLAIFVFIVHLFSVTSILLAIAKEEDDAPIILQNVSRSNSTPQSIKTSTHESSFSDAPILFTDKASYATGENIFINIHAPSSNTVDLTMHDPDGFVYRFLEGQSGKESIIYTYPANAPGNYTITADIRSGNETGEISINFTVVDPVSNYHPPLEVSADTELIPEEATNIEFFMELGEERIPSNGLHPVLHEKPDGSGVKIKQEVAFINEPVRWELSNGSSIIKYRTPPAYLVEEINNETIKKVKVESNASIHYYNVTAFTNITETKKEFIRLFWFDNGTRVDVTHNPAYNVTFIDTDNNGLINNVQWNVPMLSSQTFEIGITIINVQSYPMLGGNWTVHFNTSGISDLSITPINGTAFGRDLEFLGLWCGPAQVNAVYNGTSVSYPGWNCSDEGRIINRPITPGKHTLEFVFGSAVEHAYNLVDSNLNLTPENITLVYSAGQQSDVMETGEAKEGINLTINATIFNQGVSESGSFSVLFYDGSMEFYNVSLDSISAGGSANATGYWTTLAGTHNITVRADPHNNTQDSDRDNNNASKLINVSAWQKYYGNISGNIALAKNASVNLTRWDWSNASSGYIYVAKKDASINWSSLWALGYAKGTTTKGTTDFLDADNALGLHPPDNNATGFSKNNITSLFSSDGTNATATLNVIVHGKTIEGVAVINSTNMINTTNITGAEFITGILWDTGDAVGNEYTGAEDLVFIANIYHSSSGMVNVFHDYEIAIPNAIRAAVGVDVDFYEELR